MSSKHQYTFQLSQDPPAVLNLIQRFLRHFNFQPLLNNKGETYYQAAKGFKIPQGFQYQYTENSLQIWAWLGLEETPVHLRHENMPLAEREEYQAQLWDLFQKIAQIEGQEPELALAGFMKEDLPHSERPEYAAEDGDDGTIAGFLILLALFFFLGKIAENNSSARIGQILVFIFILIYLFSSIESRLLKLLLAIALVFLAVSLIFIYFA